MVSNKFHFPEKKTGEESVNNSDKLLSQNTGTSSAKTNSTNIIIYPHFETNPCTFKVHLATMHSSSRNSMDQLNEGISQHYSSLQNNCSDSISHDKIMLEQVQSQTLSQQQKRNLEQHQQKQQQQ